MEFVANTAYHESMNAFGAIEWLARAGFLVRGVLYMVIGGNSYSFRVSWIERASSVTDLRVKSTVRRESLYPIVRSVYRC
jgi:hypothetical protein